MRSDCAAVLNFLGKIGRSTGYDISAQRAIRVVPAHLHAAQGVYTGF